MAEYGSMFVISALAVILFFGAWNGPIPIFESFGYEAGATEFSFYGYLANLAGCVNFIGKSVIGVIVMIWIRWTLPRLRIDQVITMCWKYCVPISAACFVGVLAWQTFGLPTAADLDRFEVRENWVLAAFEEPEVSDPNIPASEADQSAEDESEVSLRESSTDAVSSDSQLSPTAPARPVADTASKSKSDRPGGRG